MASTASHTFKLQRYLIVLYVICDAPLFVNGSLGMDPTLELVILD